MGLKTSATLALSICVALGAMSSAMSPDDAHAARRARARPKAAARSTRETPTPIAPMAPKAIRRVALAPWSSRESVEFQANPVIRHIEAVFNHLGVSIEYFDVDSPLSSMPDPAAPGFKDRYVGMVSCFEHDAIMGAAAWASWVDRYAATDLPWVQLCRVGFLDAIAPERSHAIMAKYGVITLEGDRRPTSRLRAEPVKTDWLSFERKVPLHPAELSPYAPSVGADIVLKVVGMRSGKPHVTVPVFTSPHFSAAYGDYGLFLEGSGDRIRRQWVVDPFKLVATGLGLDASAPVPDVAVLNGRRVYFAHLDGDGFNSLSRVATGKYCGEIVDERILGAHPELPFGVSYIVDEIDPTKDGNARLLEQARRSAARPNVELASHTYYHPLDWAKGRLSYGGPLMRFDAERETIGSVRYLREKVADGKPLEILYWSGNCVPAARDVELLDGAGLLNVNGGDSRFDAAYPSVAYVAPLGRPYGSHFQVFAGNSNENTYTNLWEGPYFGYREVVETFKRTGEPRILKPVNPYFHFYSADRPVALAAATSAIDWALSQPLASVFPSTYVRSVLAWRRARITRLDTATYAIADARDLHTLRIDRADGRVPDLAASVGVIGYATLKGSLYVHLDPAARGEARLQLVDEAKAPRRPRLVSVGGLVDIWSPTAIRLAPFARGPIVLAGWAPGATVTAQVDGRALELKASAGPDGGGQVEIPFATSAAATRIEVSR